MVTNLVCQTHAEERMGDVQDDTYDSTREEAEEAKTILSNVESVVLDENKWKSLKLECQRCSGLERKRGFTSK
jgi:hypothetical protein